MRIKDFQKLNSWLNSKAKNGDKIVIKKTARSSIEYYENGVFMECYLLQMLNGQRTIISKRIPENLKRQNNE